MSFRFEPRADPGAWILWDNGTLHGDDRSLAEVERAVAADPDTVTLPPVGPSLSFNREDGPSMLVLLINVLGNGDAFGEVPELDNEVPEGAVA